MADFRYRHLVGAGVLLLAIANLAFGAVLVDPFFLVRAAIGAVVTALVLRFDRWWAIVPALIVGIGSLAETGFFIDSLSRFDTAEFGFAWANIVLGIGIVVFGIADLWTRRAGTTANAAPSSIVQLAGAVAAALIVAAVASAIATIAGRDTVSDSEREGALVITYEDIETDDTAFTVNAGEPVRIVIDNKDIAYHDFELKDAGIYVDLSARESKLVQFTIDTPGEYEYRCTVTGHTKMKGILTVE